MQLLAHGHPETRGGLGALRRQGLSTCIEICAGGITLGFEAIEPLAVVVELSEPRRPRLPELESLVQRTVRTNERAQSCAALFDSCQLVRSCLIEVGEVCRELPRDIGDAVADIGEGSRDVGCLLYTSPSPRD